MAPKATKAPGGKRGYGIRGRRRPTVFSAVLEVLRIAHIPTGNLPRQHRVRFAPLPAAWATMSQHARALYCRICSNRASGPRTHSQHCAEVHIGHRCHFPVGAGICGAIYDSEEHLLDHLNNHLLPAPATNGRFHCGWPRAADCPCQQRGGSFSSQQNMLRHARKHQVLKAKAAGDVAGDVADDDDGDDDDDDDDSGDNGEDTGSDPSLRPPHDHPRGPYRGDGPDPPPPAAAPQQVAAY